MFKDESNYLQETNITLNYQYFYDRITNDEISVDDLFGAVKQLVIVEIELKNGEDDPQLIFESLNSTGLDLTEADKVRNFILMKENSAVQEQFYIDFWNIIEINANYNVSNFIRDYLTISALLIQLSVRLNSELPSSLALRGSPPFGREHSQKVGKK